MYIKTALEKGKTERNGKRTSKNSSPRGRRGEEAQGPWGKELRTEKKDLKLTSF